MVKKFLYILVFLLWTASSFASHIVGGEIEVTQLRGSIHQIILKLYVDEISATPGVIDSETDAVVAIFEKGTGRRTPVGQVKLPRRQYKAVNYGENCSTDKFSIKTGLIIFYDNFDFAGLNNPAGYYLSWQNCCRNSQILNIIDPASEGMVFYTEFTPITIRNSTPTFPQFTGDFPCLGKPFRLNFGGVDKNGDSLVYRRGTPMAGFMAATSYRNQVDPGPYPSIIWKTSEGYNENNQIPGTPSFSIDPRTGEIFFVASKIGLYVFSVEVDEYRNGVKIGMVKRDFQLRVVQCADNYPTSVDLELPNGTSYSETDTLELKLEQDSCFTFKISDENTKHAMSENLKIKINSNLPPGILSITPNVVVSPGGLDTVSTNLCFDACNKLFINKDTVFTIEIIGTDAPKCPASNASYDTLRLKIVYKPQINAKPTVGVIPDQLTYKGTVGEVIEFDVYGVDPDKKDILSLTASGDGFDMSEENMYFTPVSGSDSIASRFRWVPACEDIEQGTFKIDFFLDDNSCIKNNSDTLSVVINIEDKLTLLPNMSPANLITPNGDKLNDFFEIPNIPEGNCDYYFKKVSIYNRWGAKVFESTKPDFQWGGEKQPSGLYFYVIDINKKEFRGWLEMIK